MLLEGRRIFTLTIDGAPTTAKVAKGFSLTAPNNQLSSKITSDYITYLQLHAILYKILKDSFKRNLEYEITQVQKARRDNHAFITTTSPEQRTEIIKGQVAIDRELLTLVITRLALLTEKERAKRNCLVLIVRNINKAKLVEEVEIVIKTTLGSNNMTNIFFPNKEGHLHSSTANAEVSTPATYKQYVKRNIKMLNHYVKFTP